MSVVGRRMSWRVRQWVCSPEQVCGKETEGAQGAVTEGGGPEGTH